MKTSKVLMVSALGVSIFFGCSCVATSPSTVSGSAAGTSSSELSPPVEAIEHIRKAEALGRYIFMEDVIAAKGTDIAIKDVGLLNDARRQGWIVSRNPESAVVRFIGLEADRYVALFDVRFPWESTTQPVWKSEVRRYNPALSLSPQEDNMVKARQLAIDSLKDRCSDRYNTIMVPPGITGNAGWTVYLLAATTDPNVIMYGGHARIDVSADGQSILQIARLSKTCIRGRRASNTVAGMATIAAGTVTEIVSDYPTEIQVYLSRLHHLPIYVSARSGLWKVEEGTIHWEGKKE